jgi:hypothetical protein
MRYFPKLQIFKNSTGINTFDGREARSYRWYVYALVLSDETIVMVERPYSPTTGKHMSAFRSLMGHADILRVLAPRGLGELETATRAIKGEIATLKVELLNKRNRNREGRLARIATLQDQLKIVKRVQRDQRRALRKGA